MSLPTYGFSRVKFPRTFCSLRIYGAREDGLLPLSPTHRLAVFFVPGLLQRFLHYLLFSCFVSTGRLHCIIIIFRVRVVGSFLWVAWGSNTQKNSLFTLCCI